TLSTDRLLAMEWLEGKGVQSFEQAPQEVRNDLARTLFYAWYKPLYHYGVVHGDPHLGNYTFTPEGHVNLLDFGCVRKFKPLFVRSILDLYEALTHNHPQQMVAAYESWGFENLTKEMIEVLNIWAKMLYEPLLDNRVRPIQEGYQGVK